METTTFTPLSDEEIARRRAACALALLREKNAR